VLPRFRGRIVGRMVVATDGGAGFGTIMTEICHGIRILTDLVDILLFRSVNGVFEEIVAQPRRENHTWRRKATSSDVAA
jgi:hypothetical protein